MKKLLLGTTMLIGFASAASAATPKVTVGGVADFQLGVINQDQDSGLRNHSFRSDTEVTFRVDGKTDAGLEYGGGVNLEADTTADADNQGLNASQTFVYMGGIWGRFELGSNLGADQTLKVDAASIARATGGIDGDFYYYINNPSGAQFIATPDLPINYGYNGVGSVPGFTNESQENLNKVTYYTPRFAGFQAGVSYAIDNANRGQTVSLAENNIGQSENIFQGGVNYDNKFGDFGVTLAATGEWGRNENFAYEDLKAWNAGAKVTWFGFSLAGSYGDWDDSERLSALNADDSWYWTVGGAYEFGPFAASVTYLKSQFDNGSLGAVNLGEDKFRNLSVGMDYKLAPGLTPYAEVSFFDADTDVRVTGNGGTVFIAGTQLNF